MAARQYVTVVSAAIRAKNRHLTASISPRRKAIEGGFVTDRRILPHAVQQAEQGVVQDAMSKPSEVEIRDEDRGLANLLSTFEDQRWPTRATHA